MVKLCCYILSAIITVWSFDSVDINKIFKKNQVVKARTFYLIIVLCITYLLTSFLYDFVLIKLF